MNRPTEGANQSTVLAESAACEAEARAEIPLEELEDEESRAEREHWIDVMRTLVSYELFTKLSLAKRRNRLKRLPRELFDRLPKSSVDKFDAIEHAADANQEFFEQAVAFYGLGFFKGTNETLAGSYTIRELQEMGINMKGQQHRNEAVIHSLYREWSAEGEGERRQCFGSITDELERLLPVTAENIYTQRILVPGSGLGRLPLEIASRGYCCQGNEFSAYMIIPSYYLLNGINEANSFDIYPWLDKVSNVANISDVLSRITVPDVTATDLLNNNPLLALNSEQKRTQNLETAETSEISEISETAKISEISESADGGSETNVLPKFSMTLGNFCEIYGTTTEYKDFWNGICTAFFIDTAPIIIDYIEIIYNNLKPGGVWINCGPLLYHWTEDIEGNNDSRFMQSIELSWEELKEVILSFGFEFITEDWKQCNYTNCEASMMWNTFRTIFFSVRKPL